jgi:hypothetical protein
MFRLDGFDEYPARAERDYDGLRPGWPLILATNLATNFWPI